MKRNNLVRFCLLCLIAVSCSTDEDAGTSLPEGKYPLMLTATQGEAVASPQTRVSENTEGTNSKWTAGDQIKVVVSGGDNDMEATCTLDESGNVTNYNPQLAWKTTQSSKVNAWYSNITGQNTTSTTVSLFNQSSELAYVLKADEKTDVNYQSGNISLNFKHQLAKVRVKLIGNEAANFTSVKVKSYTACTVSNGSVSSSGTMDWITMKRIESTNYYEANLVPGSTLGQSAFQIAKSSGTPVVVSLGSGVTLEGGKVHNIKLMVRNNNTDETVELSNLSSSYTVENKNVTINGNGSEFYKKIVINDGAVVTLNNVKLNITGRWEKTIVVNGLATLILSNTNELKCESESPLSVISGILTIQGNGSLKCTASSDDTYLGGILLERGGVLIIDGSTVTAEGAKVGSHGICTDGSSGSTIVIRGGSKVTAKGQVALGNRNSGETAIKISGNNTEVTTDGTISGTVTLSDGAKLNNKTTYP